MQGALYNKYHYKIVQNAGLSEPVEVKTVMRQGCVLPPPLFVSDHESDTRREQGYKLGTFRKLEELSFADDMCLLSESYGQMAWKLHNLEQHGNSIGLKIYVEKTKSMRINTGVGRKEAHEVASLVTKTGDVVLGRTGKTNTVSVQLYPV